MSSSINGLSNGYLQSILTHALQKSGLATSNTGSTTSGIDASSLAQTSDSSGLSPFAQMMSTLQQLQQTDPTKYQQVTQQIATNLESAAQTAQSEGNTTAANQLTQLSNDFTSASKNNQLPNIKDLAQAIGGGHHHRHHHAHAISADSDASSSTSSDSSSSSNSSSSSTSQSLSQLLSAFENNGASQTNSLDPMSIINNTLSSAGITSSPNS